MVVGEGGGAGGKKGFVPVNLYGRYFMPGCLSREKHLVQITGGKKLNHMPLLLLKSEISCLRPRLPAPLLLFLSTLSVGFQNMCAAVGQEGYSVESKCYYKAVGGENWDNIFVMDTDLRYLRQKNRKNYYFLSLRTII